MAKEIYAILTETLWEHTYSYATVKNWVGQFKRGEFSTYYASGPGRHERVTIPESIEKLHDLILEDRRISAKSISEQLDISRARVGSIIHEDLGMQKEALREVGPEIPEGGSKKINFWNFFGAIQMISCRTRSVTMDVTWLYHYEPETKQQSMEWRHSG